MSSKSGSENLSKAGSENLSKSTSENLPSIGSNEDVSWRIDEFSQKLRSLMSEVDFKNLEGIDVEEKCETVTRKTKELMAYLPEICSDSRRKREMKSVLRNILRKTEDPEIDDITFREMKFEAQKIKELVDKAGN